MKTKEILHRFFKKGVFPPQLSVALELPWRKFILSPRTLADRLHLKNDFRVLEIGPGPGYFSVEIARRVPQGHLELFDLQHKMLKKARRKINLANLNNVGFVVGNANDLPYGKDKFDAVVLVAVLGEVADKEACLRGIFNILRPSGLLSVTEQPGDPDFLPFHIVRSLAQKQGFDFVEQFGKKKNYTANFIKPKDGSNSRKPLEM